MGQSASQSSVWDSCRPERDEKEGTLNSLPALDENQPLAGKSSQNGTSVGLSLPETVAVAGGIQAWNAKTSNLRLLLSMLDTMCTATSVEEALEEVTAVMSLGHNLWAYAYMRMLYSKDPNIYYGALLTRPSKLLPVVYTPTVGEACQKFGKMPMYQRGCYVSINHKGNVRKVLEEYAAAHLSKDFFGNYLCDCIVFSDGGRILGLGDLGTWGMGIPIGKLDLYTVCAGVNPRRTIPVMIDAGCTNSEGNSDKLVIRDNELYTGAKQGRKKHLSDVATEVNSAYYGAGNLIEEFMQAANDIFGKRCLLQFEDFNSNDAFPLLAEYRNKFVTYNDDIQGTAAVAVAALMGAIKLRKPDCSDLIGELRKQTFLFHGAGSANIGTLTLLSKEAGVPKSNLFVTNSRGLIWRATKGSEGSYRNDEQKEFAYAGKPSFDVASMVTTIEELRPSCLIGAVGVAPGCFDKNVVDAMVRVNRSVRPAIFALSNPKTKAEITARDAYTWSNGAVIYGSGTAFDPVQLADKTRAPGQVNNVYIFPGVSFGVICCQASSIPERFFMVAAEAVANSLDEADLKLDRVVPHPDRIREVGLNVATAVVIEAQKLGLAGKRFSSRRPEVREALMKMMWSPPPEKPAQQKKLSASPPPEKPAQQKELSASAERRPAVSFAAAAVSQK